MAIPNKATGYGNNSTAQNVFKITFSEALSAAPKYEAWDNSQTFPAKDASGSTTAKTIFVGTAGNSNKPMLCLVDTYSAPSSDWKPASATAGSANPNRLKGTTNYVTAGNTPGAGGAITFNMVLEMPYDVTTSDTFEHILQIRYSYTGSAPTLTWSFNEGSEGTPTWTTMTPGTHGIRHCKSGAGAGNYYATVPESGTQDTEEGWVTT